MPQHLQNSILRQYLESWKTIRDTPDACPELINKLLVSAILRVRDYDPNDPMWVV